MDLPQVSTDEWAEAAVQYQIQAGQIALSLNIFVTEAEELLDRASQDFRNKSISSGESLVWSAVNRLKKVDSPECLQGWVKAAIVAADTTDESLQMQIFHEGPTKLSQCGLDGLAEALRNYPQVRQQFGNETARALGFGMLNEVKSWYLRNAMEPSPEHD